MTNLQDLNPQGTGASREIDSLNSELKKQMNEIENLEITHRKRCTSRLDGEADTLKGAHSENTDEVKKLK